MAKTPKEVLDFWDEFLKDFEDEIYPIFGARGYSRGTALQAYLLDQLDNDMLQLLAKLVPDSDSEMR